jgi:hypothetical protein
LSIRKAAHTPPRSQRKTGSTADAFDVSFKAAIVRVDPPSAPFGFQVCQLCGTPQHKERTHREMSALIAAEYGDG